MIGQSLPRPDAIAKVSGRAHYVDDFTMPGMRHAAYVRAPLAHALVRNIDASAALALPGAEAVFTAEDVPTCLFPSAGHPYSLDPDHGDVADRLLLTSKVRFFGDEVAVVVARDELCARRAAQLVRVDYEELPVITRPLAALEPDAPILHPGIGKAGNLLGEHTLTSGGDVEQAMAKADLILEGEYHTPIVQHCQMENQSAYAYMDDMERIVVVSSTQIPHIVRRVVGQALGIPWSRVRVVKPFIGGGFGNKQDVIVEPMAAFLSMRMGGKAVRLALKREECILATRTRHAFDFYLKMGVSGEGRILGLDVDTLSNTGAYASHGHSIAAAGGAKLSAMYPNMAYRYHARTVYTNSPVAGAMRGYGSPQVCFAVECQLDDAAHALGVDPLEMRLRNAGHPGDPSPLSGKPMHTHGLEQCLIQGAERFGWSQRRKEYAGQRSKAGASIVRGVGVAGFSYGSGTYPVNPEPAGARLILNQDGSFMLSCGATEIGQGADAVFGQMAAHSLGVDYDLVRVISQQDTDLSPFDPGAYASRQTFVNGHAIKAVAEAMRDKVLGYAALIKERDVTDLDLRGRDVVLKAHEEKLISLADLALDSYYHKERGGQISAEHNLKVLAAPPAFGCTFAEVEVDIPLCRLTVTRLLNVHDAGMIVNPLLAEGQVHGGMGMGLGWALLEEMLVDEQTGKVWNHNMLDYKIPTMQDMPELDCAFVQAFEPSSAYGTKALGEPPLLSPAPAIRNALLDATGLAINRIPLTPKLLYRHFKQSGLLASSLEHVNKDFMENPCRAN